MPKTPEMERSLNAMTQRLFGRERKEGECVVCGSTKCEDSDFRDAKSRTEYKISKMCQLCQDAVWGRS